MNWTQLELFLRNLAASVFLDSEGKPLPQTPLWGPLSAQEEREIDQWVWEMLRTGEPPAMTDRLKYGLLNRARYAKTLAQLNAFVGIPPPGAEARSVVQEFLVARWHSEFRARWLEGLPPEESGVQ